ncbi:type I-E CRISPR-associated protein Cas5/CasD [Streptococcus merionis]|uniref:type I-E CRISPR-associated protein Cas5/CasD n=1 Tax=Streptococcus merionis TaxID=400065 RepID=UPI0026F08CFA|nr:type I-E CRISPR-associated protein Cas5/CasD [Streptococcus merionis]
MKTILLKFAGPLQSWGTSSHFETRHTDFYPSKSAVIGLIAASLGYRRDEDEKIARLNELDFAVRIDQQGNLLRDFHIVQKYTAKGDSDRNYVTNRYYLEDAVFVVAISHGDSQFLNMILQALKSPYFQPFMGRRGLPLIADWIIGDTEVGALKSLELLEWQAATWFMKKHPNSLSLEMYVDSHLTDSIGSQLRQDRVESFSQKGRKFGFRYETRVIIRVNNPLQTRNTDHDIFKSIGD